MAGKTKAKKTQVTKKAPSKATAAVKKPILKAVSKAKIEPKKAVAAKSASAVAQKSGAAKTPAKNLTVKGASSVKESPTKDFKNKGPSKIKEEVVVEKVVDKKRAKAEAAMSAALAETEETSAEDEEFDPEKFFALNGGQGLIKSHTMRKERVDFNIIVRYRFLKGPLVYQSHLMNLSKGGLGLRTPEAIKAKTVLKIEIPLPHTSELFAVQAEVIWSTEVEVPETKEKEMHTGLRFLPMSLAKQAVINQFIQQRRDEVIMAKIGLDRFTDSVPVAGLD